MVITGDASYLKFVNQLIQQSITIFLGVDYTILEN